MVRKEKTAAAAVHAVVELGICENPKVSQHGAEGSRHVARTRRHFGRCLSAYS